jgi:hypothetical protein
MRSQEFWIVVVGAVISLFILAEWVVSIWY